MSLIDTFIVPLNTSFLSLLDYFSPAKKLITSLGEPYLAGHSLEQGLETIMENY